MLWALGSALSVAVSVSGCASTEYTPNEGRRTTVQGKGGERIVVDGMEIWDADGPPRRYEVIGTIDDQRSGGALPLVNWQSSIVRKAREAGGSALVQVRRDSQPAGYYVLGVGAAGEANRGPALGSAPAVPLTRQASAFHVIRYLD
jgi:hypothetical protein